MLNVHKASFPPPIKQYVGTFSHNIVIVNL